MDKDPRLVELILRESTEVVRHRKGVLVVAHRSGIVLANAGIDASNVAGDEHRVLLLPEDCNRSCREIRAQLAARTGVEAGVLIIDSLGRAWRNGTVGVALGAAGLPALLDLRGTPDLFGRELRSTEVGIADEIAAAASMLMGQAGEGTPVVLLRGLNLPDADGSAADLIRAARTRPVPLRGTTDERFVLALAGGVGGGKLARGLTAVLPPERLAIVVNTADDFVHLGLHISPDIDSVLYALADQNDLERGWGLAGETWNFMAAMERLGGETWFKLGDRDLATHVLRTEALAAGRTLSEVTALLARRPRHRSRGRADERRSGAQHRRDRRRRARLPGLFRAAAMQAQVSRRDVPGRASRRNRAPASAMRSTARRRSSSRPPIHSSASIRSWHCRGSKTRCADRNGRSSRFRQSSAARRSKDRSAR